ncbi:type IVB secretion system apparatus protein IcmL/DotI [Piscirickettsia salmonis]|uniref:type IVB secretion system apparatus protein IcmL/DotI n=1 Tax=Piscirickettsia salmonis TaxID=1238 RepID=UPI0007D85A7F|nr:Macrophage killing protein with similarity to conjugation protein [Piscirickettsiaceae bacterium NZ-RLO1]
MNLALEKVKLRNDFYRDNFRRISAILMISVMLNLFLLIGFGLSIYFRPEPKYFATSNNGQILRLKSLSNPIEADSAVISWLANAVPAINQLDFLNYRSEMKEKRRYFTKYGWDQYLEAFKDTVSKVTGEKYILRATISDVPVVVQKGQINGAYSWKLQVPLLLTFQKGDKRSTQSVYWTVVIQRSNEFSDNLFGISQIIQTNKTMDS